MYTLAVTGLDLQNGWVPVRNKGAALVLAMGCTVSDESSHVQTIPSFVLATGGP